MKMKFEWRLRQPSSIWVILSSGQAAEIVGTSKRTFLETVGNCDVSLFGETAEDLEKPVDE